MPKVAASGLELHYRDEGRSDGSPVVLLHAFPLNSGMWEQQVEVLEQSHRLIVPDLRGFGTSDAPEDDSAYTMDAFADDVVAVLDDAGVERVTLVGLSMGGYIAFAVWRRHRDRIGALVLADTKAEPDPPAAIEKRSAQQEQVRSEGIDPLIEALPGALLSQTTQAKKPDVVERARTLMRNPAAGYTGALEAMKRRPDSSGDLASIDVPVLVIVGEDDGVTPPDAARALDERLPDSRLVLVPEAGHLSNLESPPEFNGALAEFLGGE